MALDRIDELTNVRIDELDWPISIPKFKFVNV